MAIIREYCGPLTPRRPARWSRISSIRTEIVSNPLIKSRNRSSLPRCSSGGRDTVNGIPVWRTVSQRSALGFAARRREPATVPTNSLRLEVDIAGVLQQLALDRDMKAVVHSVVEFPETHDARDLDNLGRRQVLLQPLQQFDRH